MTSLVAAMQLGYEEILSSSPVELRPYYDEDDVQQVIWAAYRQVFGNDHILKSERLISAESLLRQGDIRVHDFIRVLAQSELYRQKFFFSTPQVRFIELNFKHFLGRAPYDELEIAEHVDLYVQEGYDAEINSYLDSEEYLAQFGESVVPYYRGFDTQISQKTVGFNRMFQLYRGAASSDRSQVKSQTAVLTRELAQNIASPIQTPSFGKTLGGTTQGTRGKRFKIRVMQAASIKTTQIRQGMGEYIVSYDQLSNTMQRLNQRGNKILGISPV